jgi:hypothetical protein
MKFLRVERKRAYVGCEPQSIARTSGLKRCSILTLPPKSLNSSDGRSQALREVVVCVQQVNCFSGLEIPRSYLAAPASRYESRTLSPLD